MTNHEIEIMRQRRAAVMQLIDAVRPIISREQEEKMLRAAVQIAPDVARGYYGGSPDAPRS